MGKWNPHGYTMSARTISLLLLSSLATGAVAQDAGSRAAALEKKLIEVRPDGLRRIIPPVVPSEHNNPWPEAEEEKLIIQANRYLDKIKQTRVRGGNTFFENEKKWYGDSMLSFLATGNPEMLKLLQTRDHQSGEWHRETDGIDFYACFTIKHQMRKYFQFGSGLDPAYLAKMKSGATKWTAKDPLRRPHYAHQKGKQGWGPDAKNSWVDVRTTDNLTWMRISSVYLMAEETGNAETTKIYKNRIRAFVVALYRVGTGEWDSHNYLSHTVAPIHNLYDFAKDPEVRLLAKAALDHYYTAAAVKYRNGNWNGPNKRDYNAVRPMTASPGVFSLYFGNNPYLPKADYDIVHLAASAYRPPMAVMELARKNGLTGTELKVNHAPYSSPMQGKYQVNPSYYETQYFGETFQLGTLARGTQESDANGFKIVADDPKTGAEMIQLVPGSDPNFPGSPQYQRGKLVGRGRVAQNRNLAIYLVRGSNTPWTWVTPNTTQVDIQKDVLFLKHANTWMAFHPIQTKITGQDEAKSDKLRYRIKRTKLKKDQIANPPDWIVPGSIKKDDKGRTWAQRKQERYLEYQALTATFEGNGYSGFAIEIGDPTTHPDFPSFQKAVLSKTQLDISKAAEGLVRFQDSLGKHTVEIRAKEQLSGSPVLADGQVRNWKAPFVKYGSTDPNGPSPIEQSWTGDTLTVRAGGHVFTCTVKEDGTVTFQNK